MTIRGSVPGPASGSLTAGPNVGGASAACAGAAASASATSTPAKRRVTTAGGHLTRERYLSLHAGVREVRALRLVPDLLAPLGGPHPRLLPCLWQPRAPRTRALAGLAHDRALAQRGRAARPQTPARAPLERL